MKFRAIWLFVSLLAFSAHANIRVFPTRVLVESKARGTSVTVSNLGAKNEVYEVVPKFFRLVQGKLEAVETPADDERSLLPMIRVSPKRFEMAPGQDQVVRVRVVPPSGLADGEYRCHLAFLPVERAQEAKPASKNAAAKSDKPTEGFSFNLEARVSLSIPVYFKHGNVQKTASLENPTWEVAEEKPVLSFIMKTGGNGFVYGDLLFYKGDKIDPAQLIARANGVGSFRGEEKLSVPVIATRPDFKPTLETLTKGNFLVAYRSPDEEGAAVYDTKLLKAKK